MLIPVALQSKNPGPEMAGGLVREAPAKLNLYLAVTGRRADGFHDLVSLVTPMAWGDSLVLWAEGLKDGEASEVELKLVEEIPEDLEVEGRVPVPGGAENLAYRAAEAFLRATGRAARVRLELIKRIPSGAGYGGGSSDAAAVLAALNDHFGKPLAAEALRGLAMELGSDCALFLEPGPVQMRGRGEILDHAGRDLQEQLRGLKVVLFKPSIAIETAWAYRQLAEGGIYTSVAEAESELAQIGAGVCPMVEWPWRNDFSTVVDEKFPSIHLVLKKVNQIEGVRAGMSGSGSGCFALSESGKRLEDVADLVRDCWGDEVFCVHTGFRP